MTPSIAFVIPAFNAANTIERALDSVLQQTVAANEIIVVDDGSRDDTARIAIRSGVRVIRQENGGPAAARNRGIRETNAEWIALLDADDRSLPNRLEREIPLTSAAEVAVVFARHRVLGEAASQRTDPVDFDVLWQRNCIPTSTVLLRRAAWDSVGGFDEARDLIGVEDYNLWLRLAHAGWKFRSVDEVLVEYEPTAASLTRQTLRFARAELANLEHIATTLKVPDQRVRAREFDIYRQYGLELFHYRDLRSAHQFLGEARRRGRLDGSATLRWLASGVMAAFMGRA